MMETISNQPDNLNDKSEQSAEVHEVADDYQQELSAKQEMFLDLIDSKKLLSKTWGVSKQPRIGYFGIISDAGTLPFNSDGQEIVHDLLADDSKEKIRKSSMAWEDIITGSLLEIEMDKFKGGIEEQRKAELETVAMEKEAMERFKLESAAERKELKIQVQEERVKESKLREEQRKAKSEFLVKELRNPQSEILDKQLKELTKVHDSVRDERFREFALRRGSYSDNSVFEYLDDNNSKHGVSFTPDFSNSIDPDAYRRMLVTLSRIKKKQLFPAKMLDNDTLAEDLVKKEKLIQNITTITGIDAHPEFEKIDSDMSEYLNTKKEYDDRKAAWWNGYFASEKNKNGQYSCSYSEVKRVNDHFDQLLIKQNMINHTKVSEIISELKNSLCEKTIGNITVDETYILPTGLVVYKGDEKIIKSIPAFDEVFIDISSDIPPAAWNDSWMKYLRQNLNKDTAKLATGIDKRIDLGAVPDAAKKVFDKYGVQYDNKLIDEATGLFSPNISPYELETLDSFLGKYGSFISTIKYSNADQRSCQKVDDWRKELNANIRSVKNIDPSFVKRAIMFDDNGLTIEMNEIPADVSNNIEVLGLTVQFAIWNNMDKITKSDYYEILGDRLNISQTLFVKSFGGFVYNKEKRKEVIAKVVFLNQFSKWQNNKLDDAEKHFFDQLSDGFKNK